MYDIDWALHKIDEYKNNNSGHLNLRYSSFIEGKREKIFKNVRSISDPLTSFPAEILDLKKLKVLDLSNNYITKIPERIDRLIDLETLILNNNNITDIPSSIGRLKKLKQIDLRQNRITRIPRSIMQLDNSIQINLDRNPLESPPIEIATKGISEIKKYFLQLDSQGQDYLFEAKLLIVGEGAAGKTTLAKKIQNPFYRLRNEDTTKGINVVHWNFPLTTGNTFWVNIWDFGGQEIYHATHQFFLSKRSLYLLVADSRKEDTDFFYWLNIVELLSDKSPLIIVKNEKQDRCRQINEPELRQRFENLKEILPTNLATNRGLDNIIEEVKHYIVHLPHIGTPLPKNWIHVRQTLENDTRNYISLNEYFDICDNYGFTSQQDKLQLSGYLHDLGVCLHFQDNPLLNKSIILKPHWATKAVYKVLDNETVIYKQGHFRKDILNSIWSDHEYSGMHDELLELMKRFRLCYLIPGTNNIYVAPQLLYLNQPQYEWPKECNLILRYVYEFLPKSIITQFIVIMHTLIPKQSLVWRNGVILSKNKTIAEIIAFQDKREIRIRVNGKHKKELITIIRHELEKIHFTYTKLRYKEFIPCNCSNCLSNNDPNFYPYNTLQNFIEDNQDTIQCPNSYQMVNVRNLLDNTSYTIGENMRDIDMNKVNDEISRAHNVEIRIGKGANVGNIIIDNPIQNSHNKVAYSDIDQELRLLLNQLIEEVNSMNEHLSEGQAEEVIRDLDMLVREATSKSPEPKWYKVSLEGLTKAAKNLGDIGKPVIKLAGKIVKLLM